jgi:hypothetical protein
MPDTILGGLDETSLKQLLMQSLARGMSPEDLAIELLREKLTAEQEERSLAEKNIRERKVRAAQKLK